VLRRRREAAALLLLALLGAGCGGSKDGEVASPRTVTVTVTTTSTLSDQPDWVFGDCTPAGRHKGAIYRVCYSSPDRRGIEVLRRGQVERVEVEDPSEQAIGHWEWAALSPDGTRFVATWSAECEVPIAFTFSAEGGTPTPVTGDADWTEAPESQALGWSTRGDPIVRLREAGCGRGADEPGTYVFSESGRTQVDSETEPSLEPRDVG
jgi:hypothetical protein